MIFRETTLRGVHVIELEPRRDDRGHYVRTWCREEFASRGLEVDFVQSGMSSNPERGTVRGLHWQAPPHEEVKIVRCLSGAIYDVIVDVRPGSPTFGQWIGMTLTPRSQLMLYIPRGFAHGFQTLLANTEVNYLFSASHAAEAGRGLRYNDPVLSIGWPLPATRISDRDMSWPSLGAQDGRGQVTGTMTGPFRTPAAPG
jgi:dTDP-4-dehydrorhamnose 3,5-epimerase